MVVDYLNKLVGSVLYTVYVKTIEGENFRGFHSFSSITKVFPSNTSLD